MWTNENRARPALPQELAATLLSIGNAGIDVLIHGTARTLRPGNRQSIIDIRRPLILCSQSAFYGEFTGGNHET